MKRFFSFLLLVSLLGAQDTVQLEKKIYFEKGSSTLHRDDKEYLDRLAPYLKKQRDLKNSTLNITGHTDPGEEKENNALSQKRACSVREYLVKKHGIKASRLICDGVGDTSPVADNAIEAGRKLNRFALISKKRELKESDADITYEYDKLGRLKKARYSNGYEIRFEYDEMGNILKRSDAIR